MSLPRREVTAQPRSPQRSVRRVGGIIVGTIVMAALAAVLPSVGRAAGDDSSELKSLRVERSSLQVELASKQQLAFDREAQIRVIDERAADARTLLDDQLVSLYMQGRQSPWIDVLAATDVGAALNSARMASSVASYQRRLVRAESFAGRQRMAVEAQRDVELASLEQIAARIDAVDIRIAAIQQRAQDRADRREAARNEARLVAARTTSALPVSTGGATASNVQSILTGLSPGMALGASSTPSATAIDAYLAAHGSPMTGSGAMFVMAGMRWRIDPRFLVAISGAESSFGATTCGDHNAWGWGCPNSPSNFASWGEGIDTVASGLRRYYLDEGLTTVVAIHAKYAPVGAANDPMGLNSNWVTNVWTNLTQLGGNPMYVGPSGAGFLPTPSTPPTET